MKNINFKKNSNKKANEFKYSLKERLLISSFSSFCFTFVFLIFGIIDIYSNNMIEMPFTFVGIIPTVLLIALIVFIVVTIYQTLFRTKAINLLSAIFLIVSFAGCFQQLITSMSICKNLSEQSIHVIQAIIWVIVSIVFIILSFVLDKKWKNVVVFVTVLLVGMNGVSLISDFVSKDLVNDNKTTYEEVLSNKDVLSLSKKENIVFILVDRLDTYYINQAKELDNAFFDDMTGFTYFDNNVSCYGRTFPSVPYMITSNKYPSKGTAFDYFESCYKDSTFLSDLKENGYAVNLYTKNYYTYSDGTVFDGVADNVEEVESFEINKKETYSYLLQLSISRYLPTFIGDIKDGLANTASITNTVSFGCKDGKYIADDAAYYDKLMNDGLNYSNSDKNYTFLHLEGTHKPFNLTKDCERSEEETSETDQCIGDFKLVFEYLNQMKELGIYDNSTIIITGDHGIDESDIDDLTQAVTTALFVKPKNSTNDKLIINHSPVSHSNLFQTIVDDANIKTDIDYGTSVFDVKENSKTPRYYTKINNFKPISFVEYEITGDGNNFDNWKIIDRTDTTGKFWY